MRAEWITAGSADDPTLVVPWRDDATGARFHDLRADPYALGDLPEAEEYPELARALRSLNAPRSPLMTAKCDVWPLSAATAADELQALGAELDLPDDVLRCGVTSYIDWLWLERALFTSAGQQQLMLDRLVRRLARLDHPHAFAQCVLRPALMDLGTPLEGFATSLYVSAVDSDAASARALWAAALDDVVGVLRLRSPGGSKSSATIAEGSALPLRVRNLPEPGGE